MWDWDAEQRPPPAVLPGARAVLGAVLLLGLLAAGAGFLLRPSGSARPPSTDGQTLLRAREPVTQDLTIGADLLLTGGGGPARVRLDGVEVGTGRCAPVSTATVVVDVTVSGAAPVVPSAFTLTTAEGERVPGSAFCSAPSASVRIGFAATSVRLLGYTPYGGEPLGSWRLR
ncbi:hypothetical protein [Actinoplanes friuliensis]|uniref:Uncharacterized protein n=1 Tax=Actinoplanes friuliensis DSM 7358 TaxID=1246995 RepID=U5VRR7_9ACTN|nr:hypothetical protein [Actinoplanes friuliensis]AGZ39512.1 hypothetical protein AFR_06115 [Actinoplanes friuliensis DSM 7358]